MTNQIPSEHRDSPAIRVGVRFLSAELLPAATPAMRAEFLSSHPPGNHVGTHLFVKLISAELGAMIIGEPMAFGSLDSACILVSTTSENLRRVVERLEAIAHLAGVFQIAWFDFEGDGVWRNLGNNLGGDFGEAWERARAVPDAHCPLSRLLASSSNLLRSATGL